MNELNQSIPLSPVDYVFTGAGSQPITFAFYYPEKQSEEELRSSLNEALKHFTILKSRLKRISKTNFVFDICNDTLHIEIHKLKSDFNKNDNITRYISPVKSIDGNSLAKISLTHLNKGSVLALSISHALVDGFSYFHFLSSWVKICKNGRFIPPYIDRNLFSSFIRKNDKEVTKDDLLNNCGLFYGEKRTDNKSTASHREFIQAETIKDISEKARSKNILLTENDVITGMLWKKFMISWLKKSSGIETYLSFPFDFRRILNGFPKNYFGCAITFGAAKLSLWELAEKPEEQIAAHVKSSVSRIKNDYINATLNTLENFRYQEGTDEFEKLHLRHSENGIIITNISRLPVRELDFGEGVPTQVLTYNDVPGSAAILPATGGVEILATPPITY